MQLGSLLAVYFVVWWLTFVAVLPIGSQSHHEAGAEIVAGSDPGAPLKPRLITDQQTLPGSRILDGRFTAVQQAIGTPKGRPAGSQYLREFAEDVKHSGLVAQLIEKNNVRGLTVAALASA